MTRLVGFVGFSAVVFCVVQYACTGDAKFLLGAFVIFLLWEAWA